MLSVGFKAGSVHPVILKFWIKVNVPFSIPVRNLI